MGTLDKQGVVAMHELLVSSLVTADALAKLLIEKGLITEAEFMQKLSAERADTSSAEFHRYPKAFGKLSEFSHGPTFSPLYFKERFC